MHLIIFLHARAILESSPLAKPGLSGRLCLLSFKVIAYRLSLNSAKTNWVFRSNLLAISGLFDEQ